MSNDWENAVKAATKILGPKAKIPKFPPSIGKADAEDKKEYDRYVKVRDELEDIVLKAQDTSSSMKNAITQYADKIDDDDLGLDPKNKDDAKKIDQAHKILGDVLKEKIKSFDDSVKDLRELNKHLDNLRKYKGPAA